MNSNNVSPIGFQNARELTQEELNDVGGGAKHTAHAKVTYNNGNDAEIQYDIEW